MFLIATVAMAAALATETNDTTTGYTGANPVQIAACSVKPQVTYDSEGGDANLMVPKTTAEKLNIRFSNATNKQIASVTFALTDGGSQTGRVIDAGMFSPGTSIEHSFALPVSDTDQLQCSVSSVVFSDGSAWTQPVASDTTTLSTAR
jgi:hypothetical protein